MHAALLPQPRRFETLAAQAPKGPWRVETNISGAQCAARRELSSLEQGEGGSLLTIRRDRSLAEEAYGLSVDAHGARISAETVSGARHAARTLNQLAKSGLVSCEARDHPALKLRGWHLDLKCQMLRLDYILSLIERMASFKQNSVLIEYEDKFPYECIGEAVSAEALSPEDVATIVEFASRAGVTVIPLMQSLGHLEFLFKAEEFRGLREDKSPSQICPLKPGSLELVKRMAGELIEAHVPCDYIHVGGDETWHLGQCRDCAGKVEKEGRSALYVDYMRELAEHVLSLGVRPVLWADMLLSHPECLDGLPKEVVLLDWEYRSRGRSSEKLHLWGEGRIDRKGWDELPEEKKETFGAHVLDGGAFRSFPWTRFLRDRGFDVICGPSTRSAGDPCTSPRFDLHLPNVSGFAAAAASDGAAGFVTTSWAVRRSHPETTMLGLVLGAEGAWLGEEMREDSVARAGVALWGEKGADCARALERLSHAGHIFDESRPLGYNVERGFWESKDLGERLKETELGDGHVELARKVRAGAEEALSLLGGAPDELVLAAEEALLKSKMLERFASGGGGDEELCSEFENLRARAREVFSRTLTPPAVEEELLMRFDGHIRLLGGE